MPNLSKCMKCSIVIIIDVMVGLWGCSQDANMMALLAGSKTICIISAGDWILFLVFLVKSMVTENKSCNFLDVKSSTNTQIYVGKSGVISNKSISSN